MGVIPPALRNAVKMQAAGVMFCPLPYANRSKIALNLPPPSFCIPDFAFYVAVGVHPAVTSTDGPECSR